MDINALLQRGELIATDFGIKIVAALAIFIIGRWAAKLFANVVRHGMEKARVDAMLARFAGNLSYFALLAFVVIAAINQLGVQTTSFVAVLGAAGLAVGLALQGSLSNFAAGVLIVLFRPYKVGDYIECAGVAGTVEELQIFTTVLKSPDNKRIVVPNSHVMGGIIVNYSTMAHRRIDLVIGVSYDSDLDKVRQVLNDILSSDERILTDPAPVIGIAALADSSVNFNVRPWTESANYWPLYYHLNETIKKRFDEEGIGIPFPQRDVHIHQQKPA
ncbi:MAG TPA: mechanosensitive ion channel domain-containing protein [Pseudomonadales bacterium]|nr:mechanosensitive ion channel domain-containing protein [Pseudomonadales bacterium]